MSELVAEFKVSVRLMVDEEDAPNVTMDDVQEMVASAVRSHHSGIGVQTICGGKAIWDKPYVEGKMCAEDAKFADVYVEADTEYDFELTDCDDEFKLLMDEDE
jgi:hypothetical protein